jgi:hypothetical protein
MDVQLGLAGAKDTNDSKEVERVVRMAILRR